VSPIKRSVNQSPLAAGHGVKIPAKISTIATHAASINARLDAFMGRCDSGGEIASFAPHSAQFVPSSCCSRPQYAHLFTAHRIPALTSAAHPPPLALEFTTELNGCRLPDRNKAAAGSSLSLGP
jgi:hypothetical protein